MGHPNAIEHGRRTAFILDPDTWRAVGFRLHKGVLGSRRQAVAASRRRSQRRSAVGLFVLRAAVDQDS